MCHHSLIFLCLSHSLYTFTPSSFSFLLRFCCVKASEFASGHLGGEVWINPNNSYSLATHHNAFKAFFFSNFISLCAVVAHCVLYYIALPRGMFEVTVPPPYTKPACRHILAPYVHITKHTHFKLINFLVGVRTYSFCQHSNLWPPPLSLEVFIINSVPNLFHTFPISLLIFK